MGKLAHSKFTILAPIHHKMLVTSRSPRLDLSALDRLGETRRRWHELPGSDAPLALFIVALFFLAVDEHLQAFRGTLLVRGKHLPAFDGWWCFLVDAVEVLPACERGVLVAAVAAETEVLGCGSCEGGCGEQQHGAEEGQGR